MPRILLPGMQTNHRWNPSIIPLCALAWSLSAGSSSVAAPVKARNLPEHLKGSYVVNGAVFFDVNSNGWRDQGEPAIPELPILLDGVVWALTDSCGQFSFSGLSSGLHTIVIEPDEMPAVYSGAPRVTQTIFAGKQTRSSRFEVGLFPPKPVVKSIVKKPPPPVKAVIAPAESASVLLEAEKQKALAAISVVSHQLERVKSSGYAVLVRDTVTRIEAALAEASGLSDAGDHAGALRLANLSATAMDEARKRIETETQRPLRW